MHDEEAHHAHRHLHHLVGVRVVHERAGLRRARTRRRRSCRRESAAASARRRRPCRDGRSMPCQWIVVCSGSWLVTKMRTRSPSTASIVGPGTLAVVAPEVRLHAGRDLAHDRLGDQVELLPAVVHPPRQRPAVQRDHRVVRAPGRRAAAAAASRADDCVGASGSVAAPARLTAAAPSAVGAGGGQESSALRIHVGSPCQWPPADAAGSAGASPLRGEAGAGGTAGERQLQRRRRPASSRASRRSRRSRSPICSRASASSSKTPISMPL